MFSVKRSDVLGCDATIVDIVVDELVDRIARAKCDLNVVFDVIVKVAVRTLLDRDL